MHRDARHDVLTRGRRAALLLTTALAPVAWGSTYFVTRTALPPDRPLFGAVVRALPAGVLLLALARRRPYGVWWWRTFVLSLLNVAGFFPLIFLAAYRLPSGLAATMTALAPLAVMLLAWPLVGERPAARGLAGAAAGVVGVALLVLRAGIEVDLVGVVASIGAVVSSSLGFVLVKRWKPPFGMLALTSWQLLAGSVLLLPLAALVEGGPPAVDTSAVAGYAYVCLVGTALAFLVWFRGVVRLPAGSVALIGLLNPVVGTLLGVALAGEAFRATSAVGIGLVLTGVVVGQARPVPPSRSSQLEQVLVAGVPSSRACVHASRSGTRGESSAITSTCSLPG